MIYFDNNATTRISKSALAAMQLYADEYYSNASAVTAAFTGADQPRFNAASAMAKLLNSEDPDCFVFTSGATESNNWVFSMLRKKFRNGRVVISAVEHPSVFEAAQEAMENGFEVVEIGVDSKGIVDLRALNDFLNENTRLVSIMAANNETGAIQPIEDIGKIIRNACPSAIFHTDATQAVGKLAIDLQSKWQDIDLLSFSAHKFHGPKAIGGIYIRPGLEIPPMILGGGQENSLRAGTSNTPGLAGLAAAASEADLMSVAEISLLRDTLERRLKLVLPIVIHSEDGPRLPNTSCFSIVGATGEELAQRLAAAGIVVGTGSACSSGATQPPKTLLAMGVAYEVAQGAIRVSLSQSTTMDQINLLLKSIVEYAAQNE